MTPTRPPSAAPSKRSYDSTRRKEMAAQTRAAVLAAADELFARDGWAGTGMRDVAHAAGVSVETVYAAAGSKLELLERVLDIAVVGDDEPVPLADRAEFRAIGSGELSARVRTAVAMLAQQNHRTAPLHRCLDHASVGNDELATRNRELRARMRESFRDAITLALGHAPRPETVDAIWALGSPDVYLLLVETTGWSAEKYQQSMQRWIEALLRADPEENA